MTSAFEQVLTAEPGTPVRLPPLHAAGPGVRGDRRVRRHRGIHRGHPLARRRRDGSPQVGLHRGQRLRRVSGRRAPAPFAAPAEALQLPAPAQWPRERGQHHPGGRRRDCCEARGRPGGRHGRALRQRLRRRPGAARADGHRARLLSQEYGGLAGVAYEISMSGSTDSPYSSDSRKLRGDRRRGGKQDDITVLVAFLI